jgi:hypothetical protein
VRLDGEPVNPLAYIFDDGAAPFQEAAAGTPESAR